MKEIGGYLGLETFHGKGYYENLVALNSGRNAMLYVLKAKNIKKIYIPYFLCWSIFKMCEKENYQYEFYRIDENFLPIFDKKLDEGEYLYIVNYYGQISDEIIVLLKEKHHNVIVDNVQAFFQKPMNGIDTIYSCRKFFGVPDGGYASTDATLNEKIKQDVSMDRMKHILGRYEGVSASQFYDDFKTSEATFKDIELKYMSKLTQNILNAIDYECVRKKREENFLYLHNKLGRINKLSLSVPVGPYAYPFYCANGMEIKKKLAERKIFVATLWPNVLSMDNTLEKDYAENILPLPVDQRYNLEDMQRIVEELLICI